MKIVNLNSGATLKTKNVNGVSGTNASLPLSNPSSKKIVTLSQDANYEFNGANQASTGLPAIVNDLTFSGSGTKTISSTISTINGNFTTAGTASVTAINGITINGDVVLGSGTTFNGGSYTHNIKGDWTNTNNGFTANGSTIVFNGAALQTITGTTTFKNLQINNTAGIVLASSPSSDITISQSLALANGIITTNVNKVIIGNGGSVSRTG